MAKKSVIPPDVMRQLLRYEPDTGKLFWLERDRSFFPCDWSWKVWNKKFPGKEAFTALTSHGYPHGSIMGRSLQAHRVAWVLHTGEWPKDQIDHINNDRADNRIENLREATNSQNHMNKPIQKRNKFGAKGVRLDERYGTWIASITVMGKMKHLGSFSCIEDAKAAYAKASEEMHGEFGRIA